MPVSQDSGKYPSWRKQLKTIDDPVAEDSFTYSTSEGKRVTSRIVIGHPKRVPKAFGKDWYCPLIIEGETVGIRPVLGIGPVDAVMNAGSVIRQFLEENVFYPGIKLPWYHPEPKTKAKRAPAKKTAKPSPRKKKPAKPSSRKRA